MIAAVLLIPAGLITAVLSSLGMQVSNNIIIFFLTLSPIELCLELWVLHGMKSRHEVYKERRNGFKNW